MSGSGRASEFMQAWRDGHGKPHGRHGWGADDCDRCTADLYDPWEALVWAARMAWPSKFEDDPGASPVAADPPTEEQR